MDSCSVIQALPNEKPISHEIDYYLEDLFFWWQKF
jgi:hypothetical protein